MEFFPRKQYNHLTSSFYIAALGQLITQKKINISIPNQGITLNNKRLDLLSLKWDSYDRIAFSRDALSYSKNCMLMFNDFDYIRVHHKPNHIKRFPNSIGFKPIAKSKFLKKLISLFSIVLINILLPAYLCIRYRPKVCVTDSVLIAAIYGIAKKLGLCQRTIFLAGDWFSVNAKKEPLKHIFVFLLFYYPDYLAVSLNDLTIDVSPVVKKLRTKYLVEGMVPSARVTW